MKGESAIIITGGSSADEIFCCRDSYLFWHTHAYPSFLKLPTIPVNDTGLRGHTSVTFNNGTDIFLFGGEHVIGVEAHNDVYYFSMKSGKWELYDTTGPKLAYHSAIAWEDDTHQLMVVFGGRPSVDEFAGYKDGLWIFDPARRTWTEVPRRLTWPSPRSSPSTAFYRTPQGKPHMFLLGGNDFHGCLRDPAWDLDLDTLTWTPLGVPDDLYCIEDLVLVTLDAGILAAAGWGYNMIWNEDVYLWGGPQGSSEWVQVPLKGYETPGPYRGMSFARVGPNDVLTLGGCWQEGMQPWCRMGNGIWNLRLDPQ